MGTEAVGTTGPVRTSSTKDGPYSFFSGSAVRHGEYPHPDDPHHSVAPPIPRNLGRPRRSDGDHHHHRPHGGGGPVNMSGEEHDELYRNYVYDEKMNELIF